VQSSRITKLGREGMLGKLVKIGVKGKSDDGNMGECREMAGSTRYWVGCCSLQG